MTVKEIALGVAALLQADDIEEQLLQDEGEGEPSDDPDVKLLLTCVNSAIAGLAADGFPLVFSQAAVAADGLIPYSALTRKPSLVKSVKRGDRFVTFGLTADGITVPFDGCFCVEYAVEPAEAGADDEAEVGEMCDRSMAVYLAARNYCLATGRTDEAQIWDQTYDAQSAYKRLARRAKLPARAWE